MLKEFYTIKNGDESVGWRVAHICLYSINPTSLGAPCLDSETWEVGSPAHPHAPTIPNLGCPLNQQGALIVCFFEKWIRNQS